ncbi:ABC transporter ATP-binding protein [Sneathiella chinensis]|uniref:ABC transporter ATP-binding protein n=1 Tax=Sneathiella chinensis TaxID=349750 RepID=A0ABQ5U1C8_9PROT|nr:ABC transporter ATP-binding protein [Sneathiella chinensis]GLQ05932.1 ABC transporter ATP-binding protein [Sneathiella chinensis]
MLSVRNLRKTFPTPQGPLIVLDGVNLDLQRGDSMALMGESGSGKSTLLHLIAGLDSADSGTILIDDQDISRFNDGERSRLRKKKLGLVFQQFNLIPSMTVADNLAFQARLSNRHDPDWSAFLAESLGLSGLLDRYPEQLSGGQQQRVAIGRTLGARPDLVLADEPTGNLDETTAHEVLELTLHLIAKTGCGLLMVTHSSNLARNLNHQVTLHRGRVT